MFFRLFLFFLFATLFVAEAGTRPPPRPKPKPQPPRPRPWPPTPTSTAAPPVAQPATEDDDSIICPHGEPPGGSFLCETDATCEHGNYCNEMGHCCKGPAPAGVRRVHNCPADTTWEGTRPKACRRQADCGKGASCMGFWNDPTKPASRRSTMRDQGRVCCKGLRWGPMG